MREDNYLQEMVAFINSVLFVRSETNIALGSVSINAINDRIFQ